MDNLCSIQTLFARRMFRVPDYQRGYAWEAPQWRDLIEDLELLPADRRHYTGTVVLCAAEQQPSRMDLEGNAYELFDIVDGQQRLTTIVLLLDAVRRHMASSDARKKLAGGIAKTYIVVRDIDKQPMAKLALNRDCHSFFFDNILGQKPGADGPTILAHKRLLSARAFFDQYLEEQRLDRGEQFDEWLLAFYTKVTQQLVVMIYAVDSMADVGVIFETMNNRGKPISELEKVKNYLLYVSSKLDLAGPNPLASEINDAWTHVFTHLAAADLVQADDEDRLLRAHWLMAYDPDSRNWDGSRSIKEWFSLRRFQGKHAELLTELRAYITSLRNCSTAFCDAYNPTHSGAFGSFRTQRELRQQVVQASEKLARLRVVASFLPLLMAARLRFPGDASVYLELVQLCEKFAFRVYRWRGLRSNAGLQQLYRLGSGLFNGDPEEAVLRGMRGLLLHYCSEAQFLERFDLETEDWFDWSGIKYFLYEYEEHLASQEGLTLRMLWEELERRDRADSIEHILPQTPGARGYWTTHFTAAQRQRYTHDIGNLCLTFYNSELSNKAFPEKRGQADTTGHVYANSIIVMEHKLSAYADWTPDTIEQRRQAIRKWALERWHVDETAATVEDGSSAGGTELVVEDAQWKLLTRDQKLDHLRVLADQRGVLAGYDALVAATVRHNLHLRPYPYALMVASPAKKTRALMTVWSEDGRIVVGFWQRAWSALYPVSAEHALEVIGGKNYTTLPGGRVDNFVQKLDRLFGEVDTSRRTE
jgi:hypothetical protein